MPTDLGGEVAELLQQLIRNSCVNDGTATSGHEDRSAETIEAVLAGPGLDLQSYEPLPGRRSLVARIEGRSPGAPSLALCGHTDVVPADPADWRHDSFRRGADRRRGLGSRRGGHAQSHVVDGRRGEAPRGRRLQARR